MTLIEFFTKAHVDNIATCLRLKPEKVIFVGDGESMGEFVPRYEKVLREKGIFPKIRCEDTRDMDFEALFHKIGHLIPKDEDCVMDLTGGSELVIMVMGAVLAGLSRQQRQRLQIVRWDQDHQVLMDCINDNAPLGEVSEFLTVEQIVKLHGGSLQQDAYQIPKSSRAKDVAGLWKVASAAPTQWNDAMMRLKEFESRSKNKMEICLRRDYLAQSVSKYEEKAPVVEKLLQQLDRCGAIRERSDRETIRYAYTSELMAYCLQKAGNILEVKTLLEGRDAARDNGKAFFQDCQMSVKIDWDGVEHPAKARKPETRNEIDCVLIRGLTPLFISCKNGDIEEEELYKLHTVATRFGGPGARKMLIATHLSGKGPAAKVAFEQRAKDMKISLVTCGAKLSGQSWQEILKNAYGEVTVDEDTTQN